MACACVPLRNSPCVALAGERLCLLTGSGSQSPARGSGDRLESDSETRFDPSVARSPAGEDLPRRALHELRRTGFLLLPKGTRKNRPSDELHRVALLKGNRQIGSRGVRFFIVPDALFLKATFLLTGRDRFRKPRSEHYPSEKIVLDRRRIDGVGDLRAHLA